MKTKLILSLIYSIGPFDLGGQKIAQLFRKIGLDPLDALLSTLIVFHEFNQHAFFLILAFGDSSDFERNFGLLAFFYLIFGLFPCGFFLFRRFR